jgi:alpha-ketoglutarate-dependent taurine dioxygenase
MEPWETLDRTAGYNNLVVKPMNGSIGAEVEGVRLNEPLNEATRAEIRRALSENLVIVFRGQHDFSREAHVAFARTFGNIQNIPHLFCVEGHPHVQIIERLANDTRRLVGEGFHNDSTFMETPPTSVTFHAVTVPDYGGDTAFANLYLAFETLSPTMQQWLLPLLAVHSAVRLFGTGANQATVSMKKMDTADGDREVTHPLVCTHPVSGRKFLFLNGAYVMRIVGMKPGESQALLDFLLKHAAQMAFTGRVRYQKGTVLVWDNWAAHHNAIGDYHGKYRYMERVTTGGLRPTQ